MLNKVQLIGRLGKDPETRYTGGGQPVANFSLATDESWKDKNGEKQSKTSWHNCTAWGKLAEIIQQYVIKGQLIYVGGRIDYQSWDDKDGNKRYKTVITVNEMKMLGGGKGKSDASAPQEPNTPGIPDEEIPF